MSERCLHNEVCKYGEKRSNGMYCTEEKCKQFKNRTKYVEVVRCKDCKHSIWDDEEAMWKCVYDAEFDEQYGEYFRFVEYNDGEHFCSYGERKDNETTE